MSRIKVKSVVRTGAYEYEVTVRRAYRFFPWLGQEDVYQCGDILFDPCFNVADGTLADEETRSSIMCAVQLYSAEEMFGKHTEKSWVD